MREVPGGWDVAPGRKILMVYGTVSASAATKGYLPFCGLQKNMFTIKNKGGIFCEKI